MMNRTTTAAFVAPLLLLAGCEVTDNNNGSSTISLDENRIEQGTDILANEADKAGDEAVNAIQNAGPELRQSARDIKERAGRVADKADALGDEIDASTTTPAEANAAKPAR
jgi:hypothetical protein